MHILYTQGTIITQDLNVKNVIESFSERVLLSLLMHNFISTWLFTPSLQCIPGIMENLVSKGWYFELTINRPPLRTPYSHLGPK